MELVIKTFFILLACTYPNIVSVLDSDFSMSKAPTPFRFQKVQNCIFKIYNYLIEKSRIWLRKSTLIELTERNANHIIPSCCHLPVCCRSPVDRCGSHRFNLFLIISPMFTFDLRHSSSLDNSVGFRFHTLSLYISDPIYCVQMYTTPVGVGGCSALPPSLGRLLLCGVVTLQQELWG